MKRIIYFTAGADPTNAEQNAINTLNELAEPGYEVLVRNGAAPVVYGDGRIEPADFKAGTPPTSYSSITTWVAPDPITLTVTQVVVNNSDELDIEDAAGIKATATTTIANGDWASLVIDGDFALVEDNAEITLSDNSTATFTVTNGVITAITIANGS